MKATVNIQLDKRSVKKDNTHPVALLVYFNGKKKRYSLKKSFSTADFEKLMSPRLRDNELRKERDEMDKMQARAAAICVRLGANFSFLEFETLFLGVAAVTPQEKQDVYQAFDTYVAQLREQKRIGTAVAYHTAKRALQGYAPTLLFGQVTPDFLNGFERYMLDRKKSITTVGIYLRSLRTIMNTAKWQGVITEAQYPFGPRKHRKYEIPVGRNIKKALTKAQIRQIETYPCDSDDFAWARDMWVFTYYMGGMNMADILRLKYEDIDGGFLTFRRTKTLRTQRREKIVELFIPEEAQGIINRWGNSDKTPSNYVFPILVDWVDEQEKFRLVHNFTRSVNQYMERIAAGLKLNMPLSLMTARHSFASISLQENVPLLAISESMAHASIATTENYLKGFSREDKEKFAKLLSTKN